MSEPLSWSSPENIGRRHVRASVAAAAQQLTEAPTGFDTPTLVEGSRARAASHGSRPVTASRLDQQIFELPHDVRPGSGTGFSTRGLALTVTKTRLSGVSSIELRRSGNSVNPTIPIDDGAQDRGRSLVNDRAGRRRKNMCQKFR